MAIAPAPINATILGIFVCFIGRILPARAEPGL
jgi:hypothetical protein